MLYGKKSLFFRKITAKIVGNSINKRNGDKCHTVAKAPSSHHHQGDKNGNGGIPLLIAVTITKDKAFLQSSSLNEATKDYIPNQPVISGLLAAKLKAQSLDDWELQGRAQSVSSCNKVVASGISQTSSSSPRRNRRNCQQRIPVVPNNKVHHPSYKPPVVRRSTSMKERREAIENTKKYHSLCFSSSLYRIDEVDEKGLY